MLNLTTYFAGLVNETTAPVAKAAPVCDLTMEAWMNATRKAEMGFFRKVWFCLTGR